MQNNESFLKKGVLLSFFVIIETTSQLIKYTSGNQQDHTGRYNRYIFFQKIF